MAPEGETHITGADFAKITIGQFLDVFSKSKQRWISGKVTEIKAHKFCVQNGRKFRKWVSFKSKHYRLITPKLVQSTTSSAETGSNLTTPQLVQSTTSSAETGSNLTTASSTPQLVQSTTSSAETDSNLTTASKSIFCYSVGCQVEVFSRSQQKWSICAVSKIEGEQLRILYGPQRIERWVHMASCRPYRMASAEESNAPSTPSSASTSCISIDTASILRELDETDQLEMEQELSLDAHQQSLRANPLAMNAERGALRFKVHGAMEMKSGVNYATITVAGMKLKTSTVESEENPIWKDVLIFNKFRPDIGKTATIKVKKHTVMGPVVVASASVTLPADFCRPRKLVVEVKDHQHNVAGLVCVEMAVTKY